MPKGKLQVPSTFTMRKFVNRTLKPILCKHLATLRAAIFAASLLQKNENHGYNAKNLCITTAPLHTHTHTHVRSDFRLIL